MKKTLGNLADNLKWEEERIVQIQTPDGLTIPVKMSIKETGEEAGEKAVQKIAREEGEEAAEKVAKDAIEGGGRGTDGSQNLFNQMSPEDQKRFLAWEQARIHGITPDNPDVYARFGFLLDNGVDYDNAYFMATLNRNIYESFNEDEIVKLINNVEEFSSTLSNNKRYPAVARCI